MGRFGKAKARALQFAEFLDEVSRQELPPAVEDVYLGRRRRSRRRPDARQLRKWSRKLTRCGQWLHFRHYPTRDLVRLHDGRFCQQDRMCGNCARRRGAKALRVHVERALSVIADRPKLRGYLGTWTALNQPLLRPMFDHVWDSWSTLLNQRRQYLSNPRRHCNQFNQLANVAGGTIAGEVKRGEGSGLWHVHIHGLLLAESMPDVERLRAEWHRVTGDSFVVDVRPFDYVRNGEPATADNLCRDFVEAFKYSVKLQDLSFSDNLEAQQQLGGARMLRSFGAMYGVKLPEHLLDEELEDADLPYLDWFYRYAGDGLYRLEHSTGDEAALSC